MTEQEKKEKVIKALECCTKKVCIYKDTEKKCPYWELCGEYENSFEDCTTALSKDALDLLKRSFTPQEVYDTVIEHGQHDKRFKLGDKIDYSFTDVVDILNMELMCKAGDM